MPKEKKVRRLKKIRKKKKRRNPRKKKARRKDQIPMKRKTFAAAANATTLHLEMRPAIAAALFDVV